MDREPNAQPPQNRPDRPLVQPEPPNRATQPASAPQQASGDYNATNIPDGQVDRGQYPVNAPTPVPPPTDPGHTAQSYPPASPADQSYERQPDVGSGKTMPAPAIEKEPKGGQQYYELPQPRPAPVPGADD